MPPPEPHMHQPSNHQTYLVDLGRITNVFVSIDVDAGVLARGLGVALSSPRWPSKVDGDFFIYTKEQSNQ